MDNFEDIGIDAFCEAMAENLVQDPDKKLLVQEGLKLFYHSRTTAPALPINATHPSRFFAEKTEFGTIVLWDYYTLSQYMCSATFTDAGCAVNNARTGQVLNLSKSAAAGFFLYLTKCIVGFEDYCKKNGASCT